MDDADSRPDSCSYRLGPYAPQIDGIGCHMDTFHHHRPSVQITRGDARIRPWMIGPRYWL